jgi:hypothetical protein
MVEPRETATWLKPGAGWSPAGFDSVRAMRTPFWSFG